MDDYKIYFVKGHKSGVVYGLKCVTKAAEKTAKQFGLCDAFSDFITIGANELSCMSEEDIFEVLHDFKRLKIWNKMPTFSHEYWSAEFGTGLQYVVNIMDDISTHCFCVPYEIDIRELKRTMRNNYWWLVCKRDVSKAGKIAINKEDYFDGEDIGHIRPFLQKAIAAGLVTDTGNGYRWNGSISLCAYFAEKCSAILGLSLSRFKVNWQIYSKLFGYTERQLSVGKQTYLDSKNGIPSDAGKVDAILKE